jgi:beta-lactamase regulating signal transducer with metallopeptidase domain
MILAQSFALNLVTQALGWSLLHFMWQGTLIAAVLAVALHGLRRQGANVRYVACGVAMLLMAAAPAATFFGRAGLPTTWVAQAPVKHVHGTSGGLWSAPLRQDDPLAAAIPWLVAGWLAGVGLLLVRLAGGWILVQRFKRKAVRTALRESHGGWQETVERLKARLSMRGAVRVVESAATAVPTTIGWLRPVILMPAAVATGLTPQQLEVVIAHELAHIRRHDYLVNLLQCVVETLLFYHPGVWWVSGRMREEREYCCDDLAVAVCGNPVVYARTLTSLEALRADAPALSVSATGGSLMNRICRIVGLGPARPRRAAICLVPCGICGAIGVAAAAAAALHTASAEDARKLARQRRCWSSPTRLRRSGRCCSIRCWKRGRLRWRTFRWPRFCSRRRRPNRRRRPTSPKFRCFYTTSYGLLRARGLRLKQASMRSSSGRRQSPARRSRSSTSSRRGRCGSRR